MSRGENITLEMVPVISLILVIAQCAMCTEQAFQVSVMSQRWKYEAWDIPRIHQILGSTRSLPPDLYPLSTHNSWRSWCSGKSLAQLGLEGNECCSQDHQLQWYSLKVCLLVYVMTLNFFCVPQSVRSASDNPSAQGRPPSVRLDFRQPSNPPSWIWLSPLSVTAELSWARDWSTDWSVVEPLNLIGEGWGENKRGLSDKTSQEIAGKRKEPFPTNIQYAQHNLFMLFLKKNVQERV